MLKIHSKHFTKKSINFQLLPFLGEKEITRQKQVLIREIRFSRNYCKIKETVYLMQQLKKLSQVVTNV